MHDSTNPGETASGTAQPMKPWGDKVVVCNREDGLGERLRALCNAMAVAGFLGADFKFQWDAIPYHPELHAIQPAEDTFAADFVRDHRVDKIVAGDYAAMVFPPYTPATLHDLMNAPYKGIIMQQTGLHHVMDLRAQHDWPQRFRAAFDSLPFVPAVEAARQKALYARLPPRPVAVHLRAGDIVFGEHRFRGRFGAKVVTYPVAKHLIRQLIMEGDTPVIFGQDLVTCRYLAERFGGVLAADLLALGEVTALEAAVADIVLMSRCEGILAGNSGFALMAEALGTAVHVDPEALFTAAQTVDIITGDDDIDDAGTPVPDLQRAFAWFQAYRLAVGVRPAEDLLDMLAKAIRYDRHNAHYRIVRASVLMGQNRWKVAEQGIERLFEASWRPNRAMLDSPLYAMLPKGRGRMEEAAEVLDVVRRFARKPERPWSNFLLGMIAYANRDMKAAKAHFALSPAADPASPYRKQLPAGMTPL